MHDIWFHLYDILELVNLTYADGNQKNDSQGQDEGEIDLKKVVVMFYSLTVVLDVCMHLPKIHQIVHLYFVHFIVHKLNVNKIKKKT